MTVEVTPLGVACNLSCTYCYQTPMRDAGNTGAQKYDMEAMKAALRNHGGAFTVFGGEPLLVPIKDLEELFALGIEIAGYNGIQTNGSLITDKHIELFKKYKVHVGFSLDGPGDLNRARWAGDEFKTDEATFKSQQSLYRCLEEGIGTSLILTLHRGNVGTAEKLNRVKEWIKDLDAAGLQSARLHILEIDHPAVKQQLELTPEENARIFLEFAQFESSLTRLRFDIFRDIEKLLRGDDNSVTCTWAPCDPYTTRAVHGVDGHGNLSNCGRTNKDGVTWLKADVDSKERQLALYHTPQSDGGCQGCRFFLQCKGQCPGTAIDGDWRNKSRDCATWMALLEHKERELLNEGVIPMSVAPGRRERERSYLQSLMANPRMVRQDHGDMHGDHTDHARVNTEHGDRPHGDHTDHGQTLQLPTARPVSPAPMVYDVAVDARRVGIGEGEERVGAPSPEDPERPTSG